ncbi:MAG: glycosyltransferase family 4 protein [Phycisphaerae bacterium]|nr:glycosyltransferase family 4 protein [Phycisphaerae bacterium]
MAGSQRQLWYLLKSLDRSRFTPVVVFSEAPVFYDRPRGDIELAVMPLRPWRKLRHFAGRYVDAHRLLRFAKDHRVDLIHCSYQWHYPYALYVCKRLGIPVIQHIRRPGKESDARRYQYHKAQAVIAISARTEKQLCTNKALVGKVVRIDDAVDLETFRYVAGDVLRREYSIDGGAVFGLVGRIKPGKRQLAFLEAGADMLRRGHNACFFLIGPVEDEDYHNEIKRFIDANKMNHRVFMTGQREVMPAVLSSLDVLVTLSGGSVMFEAMACGKPVISAGFTRPQDAVHVRNGETGIVIESKETAPLVDAMLQLADNKPIRDKLATAAQSWAIVHLGCDSMSEKTQRVYDAIVDDTETKQGGESV